MPSSHASWLQVLSMTNWLEGRGCLVNWIVGVDGATADEILGSSDS